VPPGKPNTDRLGNTAVPEYLRNSGLICSFIYSWKRVRSAARSRISKTGTASHNIRYRGPTVPQIYLRSRAPRESDNSIWRETRDPTPVDRRPLTRTREPGSAGASVPVITTPLRDDDCEHLSPAWRLSKAQRNSEPRPRQRGLQSTVTDECPKAWVGSPYLAKLNKLYWLRSILADIRDTYTVLATGDQTTILPA